MHEDQNQGIGSLACATSAAVQRRFGDIREHLRSGSAVVVTVHGREEMVILRHDHFRALLSGDATITQSLDAGPAKGAMQGA